MPAQLSLTFVDSEHSNNTRVELYQHSTGSSSAKTNTYSVPNGTILHVNCLVAAVDSTNTRNCQTWTLDFTWRTAGDGSSSTVVGALLVSNVQGTLPPDGTLSNPSLVASGSGFFINVPGLSNGVLNYTFRFTFSSFGAI